MSPPAPGPSRGPVSCKHYEPVAGTRRCRHYLTNGGCSLPDEFMCVEWLRVNGYVPPPVAPTARDLFGRALPPPEPVRLPVVAPPGPPRTPAPRPAATPSPAVLDESLAAFRERGLEVRLATDLGEVWIVPAYTGADRTELLVEHAALIAMVATALPGARVTGLRIHSSPA